jgi:hypothetical protein
MLYSFDCLPAAFPFHYPRPCGYPHDGWRYSRMFFVKKYSNSQLVGSFNPLKNMKVSWDDDSQYMQK